MTRRLAGRRFRRVRIFVSDLVYLRGLKTRRVEVGLFSVWRWKSHGFCWRHGRTVEFNGEWLYWYCERCREA